MAGIYNRLVAAPGQPLALGASGGVLLLNPPAQIAGQLTFFDMQCRTWHLLREPGPDTGFLPPVVGDYNLATVSRDLNIWTGRFVGETGLAPKVADRQVTVPVFPGQDYPVPPDLQAIYGIEYTPAGQQTYPLLGKSFEEFKSYWADENLALGQPRYYRQMFAGYIRLYPSPSGAQAFGPGIGTITYNGSPQAGQSIATSITNNPGTPIVIPAYVVQASDTLESIASAVANLISESDCCVGASAFLQPPEPSANSLQLTAINPPGTNISFLTKITGPTGLSVTPQGLAYLQPNGDTMTFYYSSSGKFMYAPGDTTQLPPQVQMAPVHGLLSEYWLRKGDKMQADEYKELYRVSVKVAKDLEWDSEKSIQPTMYGDYEDEFDSLAGV